MIPICFRAVLLAALLMAGPALAQNLAQPSIDGEADFSFAYQHLTGQDMEETYSNLPYFGAGFSFLIAPELRTYLGLRYGWKSGDPYHDIPGFENGQNITVKTLPFLIGLKLNLARSTRVRFQLGLALMLSYTWEKVTPQIDPYGGLDDATASNVLAGYMATFGPEWYLGNGPNAIGLEFGYGGTKGTLSTDSNQHSIDLTGFSGRIYYILGLGRD